MHADIRGRVGMLHNAASLGSRLLDEHRHIGHQQDLKSLLSSHLSDIGKRHGVSLRLCAVSRVESPQVQKSAVH